MSRTQSLAGRLKGRSFVHPVFDYLLIGGGLSLIVIAVALLVPEAGIRPGNEGFFAVAMFPYIILLANSAHFAASTVRLYTKPGAYHSLPFLTMAFPLVAIGILTLCMFYPRNLGYHLQALYLTWSPYHYAAQAYGLAVMYSYRSGCQLSLGHKKLLRLVSMLPFVFTFIIGEDNGLGWVFPGEWLSTPAVTLVLDWTVDVLSVLVFLMPLVVFVFLWRAAKGPMPLISALLLLSNGIWWVLLRDDYDSAFVLATIFHGIQYLAIVIIFHVKDQLAKPGNRHGSCYHTVWFYGVCLVLGYAIFRVVPGAYMVAGFGPVESTLLVVAAINIHHFVVDAYIWRLKKTDSNRQIVDGTVPASA